MTQMDPAELQAELDAGEEILRTATLARLAYDGIDGTPRVIPIAFLWTGEAVVVATHPSAPKFAALRARLRVALTIDTPSPTRSLLLRGSAEIEVVDGVVPEYLEAAAKSMEGERPRRLRSLGPRDLRPDGPDQHRPRLGPLFRLRHRPLPRLPRGADDQGLRPAGTAAATREPGTRIHSTT